MPLVLILILAFALSALTYLYLERMGRRAWVPLVCRGVAWSALGVLLADLSCAGRGTGGSEPLVLLDGSLSLRANSGRWAEAHDSAMRWAAGRVVLFGDERVGGDTSQARGRSQLMPAVRSALASGKPVLVVTDGEIEDADELPADLRADLGIRVFPRRAAADLAVTRVDGPSRLALGDTLAIDAEIRAVGSPGKDSVTLELRSDRSTLARRRVRVSAAGAAWVSLRASTVALGSGQHLLTVALADAGDAEPRDDGRLLAVTVTRSPGIVMLASPGDWDARFLFRALRDVTQVPLRGYVRLTPDRWRSMSDLAPISDDAVRTAAQGADLLILKGAVGEIGRGRARAIWRWPSGEGGGAMVPGDWYLSAKPSPIAGSFIGLPLDSFPPVIQVGSLQPGPSDWLGLVARAGRSGAERPVMLGRETSGVREVVTAADGFWRWAFRGGSSETGYRAWVAATSSWLLGGAQATSELARPVRSVVENARPLVFEWTGRGSPSPTPISFQSPERSWSDTLRFDGQGRAQAWAPVGRYRYRIEGGGDGLVAVDTYSDEWLPRPVALKDQVGQQREGGLASHARQWGWLFALCVLALGGEWGARRRLGLK
jgi:hypothetical protein